MILRALSESSIRRQVDPEGLLGEEVLACGNGVQIEALMQVVRNGEVEDVYGRVLEQRLPRVGERLDGCHATKPVTRHWDRIGDGHDRRLHRMVDQRRPSPAYPRELAAHEAGADDANPHGLRGAHEPNPWSSRTVSITILSGKPSTGRRSSLASVRD